MLAGKEAAPAVLRCSCRRPNGARRPLALQPAGTAADPGAVYWSRGQYMHVLAPSRTVVVYRKAAEVQQAPEVLAPAVTAPAAAAPGGSGAEA